MRRPYQKTIKQGLNARGARPCLFLCLDFARSPTDAKPPGLPSRALPPGGVRRYLCRSAVKSTTAGHPRVGLACLARCHARLHGSASPSVSAVSPWLRQVVLATWSPLAITLSVALIDLRLDKSFSWLLSPYCVIASIRPQFLTVFRRLLLCQLIIIL